MGIAFVPRVWLPFLHRWRKAVQGQVSAGREGVFVDDRIVIARDRIYGASVSRGETIWFVHVWARNGGAVTVPVPDKDTGIELIKALAVDARSMTANFVVTTPGSTPKLVAAFVAALVAFVVSVALKKTPHVVPWASMLLLFTAVAALPFVVWSYMVKLTVGADGIAVKHRLRRRFIPHDQILSAGPEGPDLVIKLRDTTELRYPMTIRRNATGEALATGQAHAEAMGKRIAEAREAYEELRGDTTAIPALARAGKSTPDWMDALRRIGKEVDAGFRTGVVGRERLWMLVESTRVSAEDRVSAAVALRVSSDDEDIGTTRRLRAIAEACAMPELGARIRIAASADEDELAELLDTVSSVSVSVSASRSSGS